MFSSFIDMSTIMFKYFFEMIQSYKTKFSSFRDKFMPQF